MSARLLRRLVDAPLDRLAVALAARAERRRAAVDRALLPAFATDAPGLVLQSPFEIRHPERMSIGRDVRLGPGSVLKMVVDYPRAWMRHPDGDHVTQTFDPHLDIGDRVTATAGLRITVYGRVTIEDDVLFAANVYLSDGGHALTRGDRPYKYQGIGRVAPVHIERGAWLGNNAVVLPGVRIGAFAVVGANSVVGSDVPAGTIVVGAPARPVRRWDGRREAWVAVADEPADADILAEDTP